MQTVLSQSNIKLKMELLKTKATKTLNDNKLRHIPNEHDIEKCSDNTRLLYTHQQKTIKKIIYD